MQKPERATGDQMKRLKLEKEPYWNLTGILLEPYWNPTGTLLEPRWNLIGTYWNLVDSFWNPTRTRLEPYWNPTGIRSEPYWNPIFKLWTPVAFLSQSIFALGRAIPEAGLVSCEQPNKAKS